MRRRPAPKSCSGFATFEASGLLSKSSGSKAKTLSVPTSRKRLLVRRPRGDNSPEFTARKVRDIRELPNTPLFRTTRGRTRELTENRMTQPDVFRMVRRRTAAAGIATAIGCHSFRATGITNYVQHGGVLESAQQMAAHSSPRTAKLYDRSHDEVTVEEVQTIWWDGI